MTQQITNAQQFIKQFLSIFTFVIFVQNTLYMGEKEILSSVQ